MMFSEQPEKRGGRERRDARCVPPSRAGAELAAAGRAAWMTRAQSAPMRWCLRAVPWLVALALPAPAARAQGLEWSTLLGSTADETFDAVARDPGGDLVVAGRSASPGLASTPGAAGGPFAGGEDVLVARLAPDGTTLRWLALLGGGGLDGARAVAVAPSGDLLVGGLTDSHDFPVTPGAFDTTSPAGFVARLSGDGLALQWATFIPGGRVHALAVDVATEDVIVAGFGGATLPATPGAFDASFNGGPADAFVARLSADGSALLWCTFVGGGCGQPFEGAFALAVLPDGSLGLAGLTCSTDFPVTAGAPQGAFGGGEADAFAARLAPDGSALLFSTFLGGSAFEQAWALAAHDGALLTVAGQADSADFPVTAGAFDTSYNGGFGATLAGDVFVSRLDAASGALLWSTFLGGLSNDHAHGVAVDADGRVTLGGSVSSPDFPVTPGAHDATKNDGEDAFVARLSADGAVLEHASYLGGLLRTVVHAIAPAGPDALAVAGPTQAPDFPLTPGASGAGVAGGFDAFAAGWSLTPCPGSLATYGTGCPGAAGFAPVLDATGCPQPGALVWLPLRYLSPSGGAAFLFLGAGAGSLPVKGGPCTLDVLPLLTLAAVLPVPPTGAQGGVLPLGGAIPPGTPAADVTFQALLADASAPGGLAGSNAVLLRIAP